MGPAFDCDESPAALAVKFNLEALQESGTILQQSKDEELRQWVLQERKDALKELLPDFSRGYEGLILLYCQVRWERMSRCARHPPACAFS